MKNICVIFFLTILFTSTQGISRTKQDLPSSGLGKHCFLIGIDGVMEFSDYLGGVVSYKYHITPNSALRAGLSLSGQWGNDTTTSSFGSASRFVTNESFAGSGGLQIHYLTYHQPLDRIKLFTGIGPTFEARYSKMKRSNTSQGGMQVGDKESSKIFTAGICAPLGIEWIFWKKFGLILEYSFSATYNWESAYSSDTDVAVTPSDTGIVDFKKRYITVQARRFLFGFSVYL